MNLIGLLTVSLGGVAGGWFAHYLWARRRSRSAGPVPIPPRTAVNRTPSPERANREVASVPAPSLVPARTTTSHPADPPIPSGSTATEGLGLARRVILHLSLLGRLGHDDVARIGFTQEGMSAALVVRQGSLVRVLQRLEAAGVLVVDRRHVSGVDRRRKVYRLTALGESVARDLRHPVPASSRPPEPPSTPEPPWSAATPNWVVAQSSEGSPRP
ncbi:MAG: PadR family transcriptional regulator [Thermoplasmata archaeon]|nr:PadR family transcriptional regulator [Thermoplasmata archaeon]